MWFKLALASGILLASVELGAAAPELSMNEVVYISQGLSQLDGYKRTIKDGSQERETLELYKFGPGLRLLIARNAVKARNLISNAQDAVRGMGGGVDVQTKVGSEKVQTDFEPISIKELLLDQNPIPASVLGLLGPILKD